MATGTKRCGIYIRVSTDKQVERDSLSAQESQLLAYCESQGWAAAKVFTDAGLSAKNTRRPALQQLLVWVRQGKLDIVLVTKIDRISRNLRDLLGLIDDLKAKGVDFVAASQSFDTSNAMGTLILNILGSFAQFEREMTADRVRENMRERAKNGVWSGGIVPFGYAMDAETKKLVVVPDEAETVRATFAEFLKHRSIRRTVHAMNAARRLNRDGKAWGATTVRRILASPTYVGTVSYAKRTTRGSRFVQQDTDDWVVTEDAHPAIIDKADFETAQAELSKNGPRKAWAETSPHLLSGLARCAVCGSRIIGSTTRTKHSYYRCVGRIQKGLSFCPGLSYRRDELDEAIVSQIVGFDALTLRRELTRYQKRAKKERGPLLKRHKHMTAEYERFRQRERRLLELYEDDVIDVQTFKDRRAQLEQQKVAIARELAEIECRVPGEGMDALDVDALVGQFQDLQATFSNLSLQERQRLLQAMVNEIRLHPDGKGELDFNLLAGLDVPGVAIDQFREVDLVAEKRAGKLPVRKPAKRREATVTEAVG